MSKRLMAIAGLGMFAFVLCLPIVSYAAVPDFASSTIAIIISTVSTFLTDLIGTYGTYLLWFGVIGAVAAVAFGIWKKVFRR